MYSLSASRRELDPGLKERVRQACASKGYELQDKIGGGGQGFVYKCVKGDESFAAKIEEPEFEENKRLKQLCRLR